MDLVVSASVGAGCRGRGPAGGGCPARQKGCTLLITDWLRAGPLLAMGSRGLRLLGSPRVTAGRPTPDSDGSAKCRLQSAEREPGEFVGSSTSAGDLWCLDWHRGAPKPRRGPGRAATSPGRGHRPGQSGDLLLVGRRGRKDLRRGLRGAGGAALCRNCSVAPATRLATPFLSDGVVAGRG